MGKMELEVKILNVDETQFIKKLETLGATFKEKSKQCLYTYDLPTIYGKYIDILTQLNDRGSDIKYETAISKLKLLFFEIDNLLSNDDRKELKKIINNERLSSLLEKDNLLELLNDTNLINVINKFHNNSKKWIRLRETNDKTTIAVKHILADNNTALQQMLETEIEIPSIKDGNELLEALGFCHKSYQEKRRITYEYEGHEIDIDSWPGIPTYFEIEGNNEEDLNEVLKKLGYDIKDAVSCTADDIYIMNGKTMFDKRELKFNDSKDNL